MSTVHELYRTQLADFVKGMLSEEEERRLRDHLSGCASCRSDLAVIESGLAAVRSQKDPEVPAHYFGTVLPHVRERLEHRRTAWSWMSGAFINRFAAPLAALILVVVLLDRIPLNSVSQESSLSSVVRSLSAEELADVLMGQTDTQWTPTAEALSPLVSERVVTSELAADILETEDVNSYETVSDLSDADIDVLLQRLAERSIL